MTYPFLKDKDTLKIVKILNKTDLFTRVLKRTDIKSKITKCDHYDEMFFRTEDYHTFKIYVNIRLWKQHKVYENGDICTVNVFQMPRNCGMYIFSGLYISDNLRRLGLATFLIEKVEEIMSYLDFAYSFCSYGIPTDDDIKPIYKDPFHQFILKHNYTSTEIGINPNSNNMLLTAHKRIN